MCRGDDFIAVFQAKPCQGDVDCVGPFRAGNAAFHVKRPRPCLLESIDVPPANISRLGDDFGNRPVDLLLDREVLGVQVNEGDFHGSEVKTQNSEVRRNSYPLTPRLRHGWKATEEAGWIARIN